MTMGTSKNWYPQFGFSRRNDNAVVKFVTSVGRKIFGLYAKYFYFDGASVKETVQTLTSATNAIAVDASLGNIWNHILTENTTIAAPSNLKAGAIYKLIVTQHASAAKTFALNAVFKIKGSWVKNPAVDSVDVLTFYTDGTNLFEISAREIAYAPLQRAKVTLTSTTNAVAINAALGDYWYHLLTENTTLSAPTNLRAGAKYTLHLLQDAVAAKTLAFNAVFKLVGGSFTITNVASATDTLEFISDGTNLCEVSRSQNLS